MRDGRRPGQEDGGANERAESACTVLYIIGR